MLMVCQPQFISYYVHTYSIYLQHSHSFHFTKFSLLVMSTPCQYSFPSIEWLLLLFQDAMTVTLRLGSRFTSVRKVPMNCIILNEMFPSFYTFLIFFICKYYSNNQLSRKHNLVVQKWYFNTRGFMLTCAFFTMIPNVFLIRSYGFGLSCEECKNFDIQMCERCVVHKQSKIFLFFWILNRDSCTGFMH